MGKRPTAAQSIEEKKLGDRIYQVNSDVYRLTMPTDFSVGDVNIYFIDGPDPVLIDTGVSGPRTIESLQGALAVIDRTINDIQTLLITHTHVDHAGSIGTIQEISQCMVYVHPRAHRYLHDVDGWWQASMPWFRNFFLGSGFDLKWVNGFKNARKIMCGYAESCSELQPVQQGDSMNLAGGRPISVHEVFGHTTDHVVYVLEDAGIVFTADHLLPRISANPTLEPHHPFDEEKAKPLVLYRESLKQTAALSAEIACPGHGRSFTNIKGRCEEISQHQAMRCDDIYEVIKNKSGVHRKELSLDIFGKVQATEVYLTLSEINAGVELLMSDGRISSQLQKDIERYSIL